MKRTAHIAALLMASTALTGARAATNFEYTSQPNLTQIHVTKALHDLFYSTYIAPYANHSVIVAILDGRADYTQIDLAGHETAIMVYSGIYRNFDSHATHVSGIVGAAQNNNGVVGVDPFATLLDIPVFDDRGWVATDLGQRALNLAKTQGARVVNMSYGPTTKGDVFLNGELNLFQTYNAAAPGQGMVLVRAAGNDGVNAINEPFAGNAATALSNLLIVGSVDAADAISWFSNRPGNACIGGTQTSCGASDANATMNFFLVAPGEGILSDLPRNFVGTMSGTSMATPHVVGAAALVLQQALNGNDRLNPGQVTDILKRSADDLGVPGVDSVYGWGLLDVARALGPIGVPSIPTGPTVTDNQVPAPQTVVAPSSHVHGRALDAAISGIMLLDDYGRAYTVDTPNLSQRSAAHSADLLQDLSGAVASVTAELRRDDGSTLSFASGGYLGHGLSVLSFDNADLHVDTGLVASVSYFTAPNAAPRGGRDSFSRTLAQDFYAGSGDVANAFHQTAYLGADFKASARWQLSGLYLRSAPIPYLAYVPDNLAAAMTPRNPLVSSLFKLGAKYQLADGVSVGAYSGYLAERGHTLGMQTGGAFSLGDGATYIGGAELSAAITETTTLSALAEQSATVSDAPPDSLFATGNRWRGSKYGIGVSESQPFGLSGIVQVKLMRAWQIDKGALRVRLPVGREMDGTVDYQNRVVSVASGGTPLELDLAYLAGSNALKYGFEMRMLDSGAVASAAPEINLAATLHWNF